MGNREAYTPGTFSWADLTTTDQDAAKTFYSGLFGWVALDMPVDDDVVYSMMTLDERNVAAIAPQPPTQLAAGVPPLWNSYISVDDADACAERAAELGGKVHAGPFDVMEAGRMAVIQDPQGAHFMIWQRGLHYGAEFVNGPGALCWNELSTPDVDAAGAFYGGVFGWTTEPFENSPTPYSVIKNGTASNGGIHPPVSPDAPPHWLVYFGIADIDAGLASVTELGGSIHAGPIDIGVAKIGIVADPQGAIFALYAGAYED